ncbi:MAG: PEP-CTERM sorting domain-containing protein [Okeania sp. SIO3I5]|uniref:C-type lectin domain-containing protein n=1 Tax=Okeania sp. SIO3I5 TaxID=2607805 RepID=UPI0013B96E42|nr:PKD domain-containing protein [Okeania sp. SIO3I5]NEQ40243.1 PEP-CTERM sorting domain-containing protein [Okeania sp. SIO3I5]
MIYKTKRVIASLGATLIALAMGKPATASILYNSSTGHYYEFVSGGYSWSQAKSQAESRSYRGLQGYLATITSSAEQNFIVSRFGVSNWGGWIGASDAGRDGTWRWVTGPEAGRVFWQNGTPLGYNNFHPGEPNELLSNTEDYAHIWKHGGGTWNDLPNDVARAWGWKHPVEANNVGYFVEYGGIKIETVPTLESFFLNGRNGNINIFEGQSVSATLSAQDADLDVLDFLVNNHKVSTRTPSVSSGNASTTVALGPFADDGTYTQTAQVRDEDGVTSQRITRTVNVQNVAPTLRNLNLSNTVINEGQSASVQLSATDPGADSISFFLNNQNIGTDYRTSGNRVINKNLGVFADNGSFTYTGQARDDDGGISNTRTQTLTVRNVAPTLQGFNLSNAVINEGDSAFAELFATDPGADAISFFLNNQNIGTDTRTSGNRFVRTNLGVFADEGTFTYRGQARDDDGGNSNIFARTLTVNNLDPIITSLTEDFTIDTNTTFNFAATATDPGINDILTFDWDFDGDGLFDDFTGSSGEWSFSNPGLYAMNLRVSDGDGGFAYGSFTAEAEDVPEPGSVFGLLTLGALGVCSRLRQRKG